MRYIHNLDDRKGMATILTHLFRAGPLKHGDLKRAVRLSDHSLYLSVELLINFGFVEQEYTKVPYTRLFSLTEKGKKVAELLVEIDKVMSE